MQLAIRIRDDYDPLDVMISIATNSKYVHTAIVEEDGALFSSLPGQGVLRQYGVNISDPAQWLVIDTPWTDTDDCKTFRDAQIGKQYDYMGMLFAITGYGYCAAGKWFCSQLSAEVLSRLENGPQNLTPLPSPASLVQQVNLLLGD